MSKQALLSAVGMLLLFIGTMNIMNISDGTPVPMLTGVTFVVNAVIGTIMVIWAIIGNE